MKESGEKTNKLGSARKMEPGSCLGSACGSGEHTCDGRSCVRIQSFKTEDLVTWFEDITEREKSEEKVVAECYTSTTVNIATALGFFSRMCSLQSLERLESEHHFVTALSVDSWPKCVRLARMSHHSHRLLRKIRGTVPREQRDDLSKIWGEELLSLESENTSDHERQNVIGKTGGWCSKCGG